ncbi:MAG: DctP family TRAP transporter solute-binding subunit [Candidatus Methylomirabilales bacterium]
MRGWSGFWRMGILAMALAAIAAAPAAAATLKLGHVLPTTHNWHIAATGFADEVKAATQGRVEIRVYPNSQLGTETAAIEGLQLGTIEMGLIGGASFQNIEPKMGAEGLPYAWTDHQHAYRAFDGELGQKLFGLLERKGVKGLAWWENGFRHITNSKRAISTPEDLKGLKLRVTPDKIRLDTFKALGALPVPMAFAELYSALQQGAVDGQENPLAIIFGSNFFEVQKYLSLTNHIWSSATLVMAKSVWERISPADQQAVQKAALTWRDKQRKMVQESSDDFLAKLKAKGMQVNAPNNALFKQAVAPVWKQYEDVFGKDVFELIEKARK